MKEKIVLNREAVKLRNDYNENTFSPIDVFSIIGRIPNTTLVYYAMPSSISGMCIKDNENKIIAINSTMSLGRQRFTAAHELYHLFFDKGNKTTVCYSSLEGDRLETEIEADLFASYFLMPDGTIDQFQVDEGFELWDLSHIIDAEQFFKISHQALLYRMKNDGYLDSTSYQRWRKVDVLKLARSAGYSDELYKESPQEKKYYSTGHYVRKVELAYEQGIIGDGKRREFLMDGFRVDMIYGDDEEEYVLND